MESFRTAAEPVNNARYAQILTPPSIVPEPVFGTLISGQDRYAISYEDSHRKIPEWGRLKLSPHSSTDMYGTPCMSHMVTLKGGEEEPRSELNRLMREYEGDGLIFRAVHSVSQISEYNSTNGKGRVERTIVPDQILYYSLSDDRHINLRNHRDLFRKTVIERLLGNGGHESLHNFKHIVDIVQVARRDNKQLEYRYTLPADLPPAFLERIRTVGLGDFKYGTKQVSVVLNLCRREPRVLPFRPRTINDPEETGIISAYKLFSLHPEHGYLKPCLKDGGALLMHFDQPSTTCAEKYNILNPDLDPDGRRIEGWSLDRIVSANYFDGPNGYVILVGPRLEHVVEPERLLAKATGLEDIKKSGVLPRGMEHGTCTPFVYASTGKEFVDRIVLLELPEQLMAQQADYSIGGRGPSAHRASIQMTPNIAKEILVSEFCQKVVCVKHPFQSYW